MNIIIAVSAMNVDHSVPIALSDLNKTKHPFLFVNNWDDVQNDPVLFRMSKLVGKYGVHISFAPDIMINVEGRELIKYLECHARQASIEGNFSNMLTGQSYLLQSQKSI